MGRKTALDYRPKLNDEAVEIWNIYCFIDENILASLHIYEIRIGIPIGWTFKECMLVIQKMKSVAKESAQ